MILPLVSELLARIARRPAVEEACDKLRRLGGEVRLAGLTDSAKALLVPLVSSPAWAAGDSAGGFESARGSAARTAALVLQRGDGKVRAARGASCRRTTCCRMKIARRMRKFPKIAPWRCGGWPPAKPTC